MRTVQLFVLASVCAAASVCVAVQAKAQIVEYQGADPNAQPGSPYPNSSAASASFDAAAGGTQTLVTFEQSPLGTFNNLAIAPGASISGSDYFGNGQTIQNSPGCGNLCGFNTTVGGANYVQVYGGSLTFSFSTGVDAFGAFLTGVQVAGETITFSDGQQETLFLPNPGSGVEFFGFTDAGASIASISINAENDIIGVDDVTFAVPGAPVPEPAALGVFAIGLAGLTVLRRPSRKAMC